ncbi:tRNA lysidine(34) synthetase TilS [Stratiformator vulcanicus]|uniref:tRNA(Ile)-lysidine synthase n=1 Tax=Stratiformator vulcanicus TaxID=2527980 RepID=A0A517R2J7_9PLAN|nr:tRNA lysidine(34) synthetase TilS [Stratiformator vulcanicus]QDT38081.1 tRNA(Ile)-lysidine synthase [Stratiformator vulcanicus]
MIDTVRRCLARFELSPRQLLVAVSGGPDSIALLRALAEIAATSHGGAPTAAHVDHRLRSESSEDAAWVADECRRLGIACHIRTADVPQAMASEAGSLEESARRLRYENLTALADELDLPTVATAHTRNDQVETILHHIVRGTGLEGLGGMPEMRPLNEKIQLLRPMLDVSKAEVLRYLESCEQQFLVDSTNRDERFTRNRLRHQLIPLLTQQYNPAIEESLLRLGQTASEAQAALRSIAIEKSRTALIMREADRLVVATGPIASLPRHLIREVWVVLWNESNWPRAGMGKAEWEALADVTVGNRTAVSLPDLVEARRHVDRVIAIRRIRSSNE